MAGNNERTALLKASERMQDAQLLSGFHEPHEPSIAGRRRELPFDSCRAGVVLRSVLFVEVVVAVGATYGAADFRQWAGLLALLTGAALPATLIWLVLTCLLKNLLGRLSSLLQHGLAVILGAVCGGAGCAILVAAGFLAQPPWWASAFSGGLLAAILTASFTLRARSVTPASTTARLAELQARIRPHFLFNTLNSAIALVHREPARAEALLEDLSDLFRHALSEPGAVVTLAQEIELAQRYLAIEQIRFGDRLQVEWELDEKAGGARMPPLMLQPLLENAVKHGVEPSAAGAQIKLSTQRRGSTVVVKVTNTVPAGQGKRGHGVAQDNVRDRLRLLHDVQGQFQTALVDGVYQVRIEVPA